MDLISNLATGFGVALSLQNLAFALGGVFIGTLIGVLPGLGPVPAIAMPWPSIYTLEPTSALFMLAGVYYGAQYGGSTTAILINLPSMRKSLFESIKASAVQGTGAGQWSARKAQLLAKKYKAKGGGYRG